jgi:hypothetical protein
MWVGGDVVGGRRCGWVGGEGGGGGDVGGWVAKAAVVVNCGGWVAKAAVANDQRLPPNHKHKYVRPFLWRKKLSAQNATTNWTSTLCQGRVEPLKLPRRQTINILKVVSSQRYLS